MTKPIANPKALLTYEQVAAILGCHHTAVWQGEQRAFKKIKQALEAGAKAAGLPVFEWLFADDQ